MQACRKRLDSLTKPQGSLGRLEELAVRIAGITGNPVPAITGKVIFTLAADHGVAEEGVSAFPQEVTRQMLLNFVRGGAAINVLAKHAGARVVVADLGVAAAVEADGFAVKKAGWGTANMLKTEAMSPAQAAASITHGIELFEEEYAQGIDIAGTGEMGIANTTAASAVTAAFTTQPARAVCGKGTGISDERLAHKISVVDKALHLHQPDPRDPVGVLAKVGGFEIAGMAGVMLAAAAHRVPVVIDGFISGAAALCACALQPRLREFLIASHRSVEQGHTIVLHHLGLEPLFDLGMRLGEGTGAALGIMLAEASVRVLREMATFGDAGVSDGTTTT